jgi:hypothetical protein
MRCLESGWHGGLIAGSMGSVRVEVAAVCRLPGGESETLSRQPARTPALRSAGDYEKSATTLGTPRGTDGVRKGFATCFASGLGS